MTRDTDPHSAGPGSQEDCVLQSEDTGLLRVTLNRPQAANAITTEVGRRLRDLFRSIVDAPSRYRCVILTGAGERHFCAGGDLRERKAMTNEQWFEQHRLFEEMTLAILDCPVPVICAVNGAAFAGGCEIALCCDFIYAAAGARFALTETSLGIMPGCGGTQNLPRALGVRRAKELIYTARAFSAEDALEWGLVNRICPSGSLLDTAVETARRICENAPVAIRQAKRSIDYGQRADLRTAMFMEVDMYNRLIPMADRGEGVLAYNEKRAPNFRGE